MDEGELELITDCHSGKWYPERHREGYNVVSIFQLDYSSTPKVRGPSG